MAEVTSVDCNSTRDEDGMERKQSIAIDERYTCRSIEGRARGGGERRGGLGGYYRTKLLCSVFGWEELMYGLFVQIVQKGGETSLGDHISLKGAR